MTTNRTSGKNLVITSECPICKNCFDSLRGNQRWQEVAAWRAGVKERSWFLFFFFLFCYTYSLQSKFNGTHLPCCAVLLFFVLSSLCSPFIFRRSEGVSPPHCAVCFFFNAARWVPPTCPKLASSTSPISSFRDAARRYTPPHCAVYFVVNTTRRYSPPRCVIYSFFLSA